MFVCIFKSLQSLLFHLETIDDVILDFFRFVFRIFGKCYIYFIFFGQKCLQNVLMVSTAAVAVVAFSYYSLLSTITNDNKLFSMSFQTKISNRLQKNSKHKLLNIDQCHVYGCVILLFQFFLEIAKRFFPISISKSFVKQFIMSY